MNIPRIRPAIALCTVLFSCGLAQADSEVKSGLWQTTIISEVEGMPFTPPPLTVTDCVTGEDVLPMIEPADQHCEVMEQEVSAQGVQWRMLCSTEGTTTRSEGRIRYQGETYQGEVNLTMAGGAIGEMRVTEILEGRRLGECT